MDAPVGHRSAWARAARRRRSRRRARGLGALLAAGLAFGCAGALPWLGRAPATGSVRGWWPSATAGPVVVYLEPLDARVAPAASGPPVRVVPASPGSAPSFAVVARGASVRFPHRDAFVHRIFSYSEPNAFDLGVVGPGDAPPVRLEHTGSVRFYCSLHPWETGLIFVAPSPWFDTPEAPGPFEIREVPAGRYRLFAWSGEDPAEVRTLSVQAGEATALDGGEHR
jgi:hypothetical protein